jgi:hypothetical protein
VIGNAADVDARVRPSRGPNADDGYAATREAAMAAFAKSWRRGLAAGFRHTRFGVLEQKFGFESQVLHRPCSD